MLSFFVQEKGFRNQKHFFLYFIFKYIVICNNVFISSYSFHFSISCMANLVTNFLTFLKKIGKCPKFSLILNDNFSRYVTCI